jgi:hypothetical protein
MTSRRAIATIRATAWHANAACWERPELTFVQTGNVEA